MAEGTRIAWTDATWSPVTGCSRTSPGCAHCYALSLAKRLKAMGSPKYQNDGDPLLSGPGFGVTCHPDALDEPLRWKKPKRVFVCSMSDLFHAEVPDEFIGCVFDVMLQAPEHTYQILTKRPQRMAKWVSQFLAPALLPSVLEGIWLGTSIESDLYTFRADHLRSTPAAVRWVSAEPLLGPLPSLDLTGIDWVVIGGESGPHARPMDLGWVRDLLARCAETNVRPFVKQLGTVWSAANGHGRGAADDPSVWPDDLRVREWPS